MSFDISKLAVEDTATLHLKDAKGELLYADAERKKPLRITLYGPGSDVFGVVEGRQTARSLKRLQEDGKVTAAPHEDRIKEAAEDLAAITAGFENISYGADPAQKLEGQKLFIAVYGDPKLGFIAKQARQFVADWGNFTRGSSAT